MGFYRFAVFIAQVGVPYIAVAMPISRVYSNQYYLAYFLQRTAGTGRVRAATGRKRGFLLTARKTTCYCFL